jgi:hypothetical protein
MKQLLSLSFTFYLVIFSLAAEAQKKDTIKILPANINTKVLREGTHRYLVYFKMGKDATRTETQFWTRTIERTLQNNKPVIIVKQEWENKDTIVHTVTSVCDAKTMKPLYHQTWWNMPQMGGVAKIDFENDTISLGGKRLSDADTSRMRKLIWQGYKSTGNNFFLNWHLDLEIFPTLPYKNGATFIIPFYDPGTRSNFQNVIYTVTGSAELQGYNDQKIDCWLLVHEEKGNKEVFWISKKTKEVLKLEQDMGNGFRRFKIKLGFSM